MLLKLRAMHQRNTFRRALIFLSRKDEYRKYSAEFANIFANDDLMEIAYVEAMKLATAPGTLSNVGIAVIGQDETGTPIVDALMKLLEFFIANGPALIELIVKLIGLFGMAMLPSSMPFSGVLVVPADAVGDVATDGDVAESGEDGNNDGVNATKPVQD